MVESDDSGIENRFVEGVGVEARFVEVLDISFAAFALCTIIAAYFFALPIP